jgi:hypothetical protein
MKIHGIYAQNLEVKKGGEGKSVVTILFRTPNYLFYSRILIMAATSEYRN